MYTYPAIKRMQYERNFDFLRSSVVGLPLHIEASFVGNSNYDCVSTPSGAKAGDSPYYAIRYKLGVARFSFFINVSWLLKSYNEAKCLVEKNPRWN